MGQKKPDPIPTGPAVLPTTTKSKSRCSIISSAKGTAASPAPKSIPWVKNPEWTDIIVNALKNDDKLWHDLFSSRLKKKKSGGFRILGVPKSDHHLALAELIFKDDKVFGPEWLTNPNCLGMSVNGHMDVLKHDYWKYQTELNGTSGRIMAEQQEDDPSVVNRIAAINKEFPWYDDLPCNVRDHLAYNPVAVTNLESKSSTGWVDELAAILQHMDSQKSISPTCDDDEDNCDDDNGPTLETQASLGGYHNDDDTGWDQMPGGTDIKVANEDLLTAYIP
ncbi:hypothetical protein BS47DRAFT_1400350 [Hydnum rufescens UP504]|uniref:Uncharacterized protein n=1 Tax=Hydnum rufescens UP504 TaxID=1448309 RepID=A0A9P6AH83_9AGAM|nr:hypothetical protein BS47DRAFT_1400350 [Hydnum rufescens UP504]